MNSLDKRPELKEMDVILGTRNVRIMYTRGLLRRVAQEIPKYKLELVGI
jgi:hypothetical protein